MEKGLEYLLPPKSTLRTSMGRYLQETHRKMHWIVFTNRKELYFANESDFEQKYDLYLNVKRYHNTQVGYHFVQRKSVVVEQPLFNYTSICVVAEDIVMLHSSVPPPISTTISTATGVWSTLCSIPNQTPCVKFHCDGDGDGEWIYCVLMQGSLVMVCNGYYMPLIDTDVYSTSCVIDCENTGTSACGAAAERLATTDNYCGKIMGTLLIQLILCAT